MPIMRSLTASLIFCFLWSSTHETLCHSDIVAEPAGLEQHASACSLPTHERGNTHDHEHAESPGSDDPGPDNHGAQNHEHFVKKAYLHPASSSACFELVSAISCSCLQSAASAHIHEGICPSSLPPPRANVPLYLLTESLLI